MKFFLESPLANCSSQKISECLCEEFLKIFEINRNAVSENQTENGLISLKIIIMLAIFRVLLDLFLTLKERNQERRPQCNLRFTY